MARPLIQCGIGDLERTFAESSQDAKILRTLKQELGFRQVPRAVALLAKVNLAMKTLAPAVDSKAGKAPVIAPADSTDIPSTQNLDLFEEAVRAQDGIVAPQPEPGQSSTVKLKSAKRTTDISAQAAYALLNANVSSTWESIEEKRQAIVQRASPELSSELASRQREQMMFEAEQANIAYAVLLRERSKNVG